MPRFLLRNLDPYLRRALECDAELQDIPLQEIIRSALCDHYDLDCSEIKGAIRRDAWEGVLDVLVLMQPELHEALKRDSKKSRLSMQELAVQILHARYVTEAA